MANILTVAKQHTIIVLAQLGRSQRQIAAQLVPKQAYISGFCVAWPAGGARAQSVLADPGSGSAVSARLSFHHLPPQFLWA